MPIIDPNTLTEEQRELILKSYNFNRKAMAESIGIKNFHLELLFQYNHGKCEAMEYLFGRDFFNKGDESKE